MHTILRSLVLTSFFAASAAALAQDGSAPAIDAVVHCGSCDGWNKPQKPFKLYGNSWYVGTAELSAVLVTSEQGHVLLDAALPQSARQIAKNIESLGFKLKDVKLIVNSHAHFDHAGGIEAMRQLTGAQVAVSASSAGVMAAGTIGRDDPQFDVKGNSAYPKTANVKIIKDGEVMRVGSLALTAHMTPGHTPGGTTWSWRSCEGARCLDMVYADSLNPVSTDGFYYSGRKGGDGSDDISASFKASIATVAALPCDVVVSVHPGFSNLFEKLAAQKPGVNSFIDPAGCRVYAGNAERSLTARLAREAKEKAQAPAKTGA